MSPPENSGPTEFNPGLSFAKWGSWITCLLKCLCAPATHRHTDRQTHTQAYTHTHVMETLCLGMVFKPRVPSWGFIHQQTMKVGYSKARNWGCSSRGGRQEGRRDGGGIKNGTCQIQINGEPRIKPHTYSQLIFNKAGKNIKWEKVSSTSVAEKVGLLHVNQQS